ncbi:sensor histidine kinase [Desulforhopalus singaporensis]|uniref:histidine kinase n=1 Tax=Desulforhopalus singaporensis TaxID=91360 RepID=A0A1H0SGK2_9BACT|nr:ATP-binding protein [Desulforhopalus singaporensis]SDP40306.1 Signal transduction histidine kinase [Desulforhopalus singaporensis]
MEENGYQKLGSVLSTHFFKYSLIPILVVEVALVILYFSINAYISRENIEVLFADAKMHSQSILRNEAQFISDKLSEVSRLVSVLQKEHELLFANPDVCGLPNGSPEFRVAPNGVFYKTNKVGASLYYSANTNITAKKRHKAIFTEAMDVGFKSIVDINPNIVAAYFNSWDDMNRLYPFIDRVYEQYGAHIDMEKYNFYYLADKSHNPEKKPKWTGAYLDPAGNGWMLSCVVPIYHGEFLEGVTGLDITIESFVANILSGKLSYAANMFMVDGNGMIIAMPEKIENLLGLKELKEHVYEEAILKTVFKPESYNILTNNSPFASHFKNLFESPVDHAELLIDGKKYLTMKQMVVETGWKLMILIDEERVLGSVYLLRALSDKIGYGAVGLMVLFYICFYFFVSRRIGRFSDTITRPLHELSDQTSQIAGEASLVSGIDTHILEIHQLSNNFVNMDRELGEREKRLIKAKQIAEASSRVKSEFLANMSHELRTPMNAIIGMGSLALLGNLPQKERGYIEKAQQASRDLMRMLNDILEFSLMNSGDLELSQAPFSLSEVVWSVVCSLGPEARDKNIELVVELDSTIPQMVVGDQQRVGQLLSNIVGNGVKFTKEHGKVTISVVLRKTTRERTIVEFAIADTGIGISECQLDNLFTEFSQVDNSSTRKHGGAGLGLAIARQLVELMGGKIGVESEPGKGSLVKFTVAFVKQGEA